MTSPSSWADDRPAPRDLDGSSLLERAVSYTRGSLQLVGSTSLTASTPCRGWDLHALLRHMNDSLATFTEAAEIGYVDLVPVRDTGPVSDPSRVLVERLRGRACALLAAWAHPRTGSVRVADRVLRSDLLASAGSLEIAVHGWDVAQACGVNRPLPPALAADLGELVPALVSDDDRPGRFAEPIDVPVHAPSSTRLLAALGRRSP
ncbi:MAG: TIGR03086 family metal-binding protein [Nocardioidaceae bacterium]